MHVLMLNSFDGGGGAARAALRLQKGLQGIGVDSRMQVQFKSGDERDIFGNDSPMGKLARSLKLYLELQPLRLYPHRPEGNFSVSFLPDRLAARVADLHPDIVHLHWLAAGFMRLESLRKLNRPLVWTLHDSWAFTGGCHVPFECQRYQESCGACPVLGSTKENDLSRWIWNRKKKAWRDLNLTVITPSRWLAECARSSSLFRDVRVEVIPNGLDLSLYKPVDKRLARKLLNLPLYKKLILFGSVASTSDRNKGFHLFLPALQKISAVGEKETTELVMFGASEPFSAPAFGMKARYFGRLHDDISLALLYSAADVFVAPSLLENLPNTVVEAMACGTPCVAFHQGGMPELIEHEGTGYLARPYDVDDLAAGIGRILEDETLRQEMAKRSRRKIEAEFSVELAACRYVDLYRDILGNAAEGRYD